MMHWIVRMKLWVLLAIVLAEFAIASTANAQKESTQPFAPYPERIAPYVSRLHKSVATTHPAFGPSPASRAVPPNAFREDFPGGFSAWQKAGRAELTRLLGLEVIHEACRRHSPTVTLGKIYPEDGYTRQIAVIQTELNVKIPFWLLRPTDKSTAPRPLAICAHGHDTDGWNTYAGVYKDDAHRQKTLENDGNVGVQAVRRGFVVLAPATRGLAAVTEVPDINRRHGDRACRAQLMHCLLVGRTAVGERVWDTQRILDWATEELEGIDSEKIVMLGNSGGGVLTVYVAALDQRIAVAVPSCSLTSYTSDSGYIFHCDCCIIPGVQTTMGDMPEVAGLAAPRAMLAVHGRKDSLHSTPIVDRAMARVQTIYRSALTTGRFRHQWGEDGHKFYPELMWPFIESQLDR